jgi:hypothetical protein
MALENRREAIYRDEQDREYFLQTSDQACGKMGW